MYKLSISSYCCFSTFQILTLPVYGSVLGGRSVRIGFLVLITTGGCNTSEFENSGPGGITSSIGVLGSEALLDVDSPVACSMCISPITLIFPGISVTIPRDNEPNNGLGINKP